MKAVEFLKKVFSGYFWGNLLAMALAIVLFCVSVKYGIQLYTHHGESIAVPNLKHKSFDEAERLMKAANLEMVVSDTGYVKTLPPDCILEQSIFPGVKVKSGRVIYVTLNASHTPTLVMPDVIDNSSLRECMAKLKGMGFKLGQPEYVPGEKDWVYGIVVRGHHVAAGDKISIEDEVIIEVGNGMRSESDSVNYVDPVYPEGYFDSDEPTEEVDVEEIPMTEIDGTTPQQTDPNAPAEPSVKPSEPSSKPAEQPAKPAEQTAKTKTQEKKTE